MLSSLVLRIPSDLEKYFRLKPGESVSISKIRNKIVIEPEDYVLSLFPVPFC